MEREQLPSSSAALSVDGAAALSVDGAAAPTMFQESDLDDDDLESIDHRVSIIEPPTNQLSCVGRIGRCCRNRLIERDWSGSFFRLKMVFWIAVVFGAGVAVDYRDYEDRLWGEEIETWIYLVVAALVAIYAGRLADRILFIILDLIFFSRHTIVLVYYLNAVEGNIGLLVAAGFFEAYYSEILGRMHQTVDRAVLFFTWMVIGRIIHHLVIKVTLRKTLFARFNTQINEVLTYKNFVYRLSTLQQETVRELFTQDDHDINWKLSIARDRGFETVSTEGIREIHRRDRMDQFITRVWQRLMTRLHPHGDTLSTSAILRWAGIADDDPSAPVILKLLDPNQDTSTTAGEFQYGLMEMFTAWKQMRSSLLSQNNLSKALTIINGVIYWFVALIIFFLLFKIEYGKLVNPLLGLMVSISFAIGGVVTDFVRSLVFISIIHPFDVGDKIQVAGFVNNNSVVVRKIDIMKTEVYEVKSGLVIQLPNPEISRVAIYNHARSKDVTFTLEFQIGEVTTPDKLAALDVEIREYLNERPFTWKPKLDLYFGEVNPASGKMFITYWVAHQLDWSQGRRIWLDRTALVDFIRMRMLALEIDYVEFDLPLVMKPSPGFTLPVVKVHTD